MRLAEKGVGLALKRGWETSEADILGYMDLDLATDLSHLPEAIAAISQRQYDICYGTRLHPDARVIGRSLKREIVSRIFNSVLRLYLGVKFSDGMCGFKFLRRAILPELRINGAVSNGWFFSTELLVVAERLGFTLYELPVHWTDDDSSKVKIMSLSLEYLKAMRRLKNRKQAKRLRKTQQVDP